jgi:hypothetical protein
LLDAVVEAYTNRAGARLEWSLKSATTVDDKMRFYGQALAQAKRPDAFAYYQGQLQGRSADTWIWQYLSDLPLH